MASEEAKALLDFLMGTDRNAPLPKGAAVPSSKRNKRNAAGGSLVLPGKRHKSCYDKDIDPLYTAWGIDVYELFVNTKSDLGTNPYIVDEGALLEFRKLPPAEQDALGYHYFLYQKLLELVRQCDRTVNRNKEKLKQELNRKLSQRGGQDFVEDVDDAAVESLATAMIQLENMNMEVNAKLSELDELIIKEDEDRRILEPLLEKVQKAKQKQLVNQETTTASSMDINAESNVKNEDDQGDLATATVIVKTEEEQQEKQENSSASSCTLDEQQDRMELDRIQMELGKLTLQKQRILYDIARLVTQIVPLQETVETQRRQLNYVRSDISTDKTVCEISGNFMSARDADERIAAHYAGKQYVGWKLVRDKLKAMSKQYGPYGPPPPQAAPPPPRGGGGERGGQMMPPPRGDGGGPMMMSRGGPPGSGGDRGSNSGGGGGRDRNRSGGGGGGGGHFRGGPPDRGRWERGAPPPPGYQDRRGPPPRGDWRR